ncbi:hypothetical protein BJX70DRAFT_384817 [Aspergillus crustosus]
MTIAREKLLATAASFTDTFGSWDVDIMLSVRAPECRYHMCCPSFKKTSLSNDQTRDTFPQWKGVFKRYKLEIITESQTLVDEAARKVAFRARGSGESIVGLYENEYFFILRMTEDCSQVAEAWEFYDTIRLQDLQQRLQAGQIAIGGDAPFSIEGVSSAP